VFSFSFWRLSFFIRDYNFTILLSAFCYLHCFAVSLSFIFPTFPFFMGLILIQAPLGVFLSHLHTFFLISACFLLPNFSLAPTIKLTWPEQTLFVLECH
jgi:hypothetical protein